MGQISAGVRAAISSQQHPPHVVGPRMTALPIMQSSEEPTGPGIEARNVIQQLPLDPALTEYPTTVSTSVPAGNPSMAPYDTSHPFDQSFVYPSPRDTDCSPQINDMSLPPSF